ncbi:3-methyl-2-oxobutanoate hydroxymethyltransferase [Arenivirga flava]|uniref:3-methyl-2-oxobutanoate hydroxymethyltransferase n=1 Tax=Arenivirga flava TaxID=1930060 RepID=A0AA37UCN3_9MICO|nr:3-methyl-2-oxobutanoate hydroxymethyltransferase [Arenivirga flava]GMA27685.1 3-methyl-2-oxobutanoate hydroxymethyltransferase [Arenivirga flava]
MSEAVPQQVKRVRTRFFGTAKQQGTRITALTSYDALTAQIFDEAGIDFLLVGDSAGNVVFGHGTTVPVTLDELLPLSRAVAGAVRRAMVVADLPFGSYEVSPEQAVGSAVRLMKEGAAHAVKLEGGVRSAASIRRIVDAGVPVMGHVGYTPQSEHALGGHVVQGRGAAAEQLLADALAVQEAGAFAVVLEMVPAGIAREVSESLAIPTIGIGAGAGTDGQILVWQDFAGLTTGRVPRFVKAYADLRGTLTEAATAYADDVRTGAFPAEEHSFGDPARD